LEPIFKRWNMWNDDQPRLYARLLGGERSPLSSEQPSAQPMSGWEAALRYLPALGRAACVTFVLSCLSMTLAVLVGVLIASGRVYGPPPIRVLLTAWVELIRGTPL